MCPAVTSRWVPRGCYDGVDVADAGRDPQLRPGIETIGTYTEAKVPFFWDAIRKADNWAQECAWIAGPSDH
jgi:hypothetical protein